MISFLPSTKNKHYKNNKSPPIMINYKPKKINKINYIFTTTKEEKPLDI